MGQYPVVHFEVMGTDGPALERFYSELFGWSIESMPAMNYGVVNTNGSHGINGGIGTVQEGQPTGVTFYVSADELQPVLDKAEKLGGRTVAPIMEIPNVVTFAQFADPEGNVVGLVKSDGEPPAHEHGDGVPVAWFEVLGSDAKKLHAFYSSLFGWQITVGEGNSEMQYGEVKTGVEDGIGGGIGRSMDGSTQVTVYSMVDDVAKYLERAESLGGSKVMGPMEMNDGLTIGAFRDPQGSLFGLFSSKM